MASSHQTVPFPVRRNSSRTKVLAGAVMDETESLVHAELVLEVVEEPLPPL